MSASDVEQHTSEPIQCERHSYDKDGFVGAVLTHLLAAVLLLIGIATVVWSIRLIIRCYTPAWVSDQWAMASFLIQTHDHPSLRDLWSQHNEHRIILQRLLCLADMFWFNNAGISLRVEIVAVQFIHLGVFLFACFRWGKFRLAGMLALGGFLAYCFFSPLQMENFNWGFQVTFVLVALAASSTILLMLLCGKQAEGSRKQLLLFTLTIVAAAVTEMGNADGILIWPILLFMAFVLQVNRRQQLVLAIVSACGIVTYLIGYHSPTYHSNPLETIRHPGAMCKYMVTCFGYSWNALLPNPSRWPTVAESSSFLSFLALAWLTCRCLLRRRSEAPLFVFILAVAMFSVGTIALAAAGRLKFGYVQATSSRYQSFALLLWACTAVGISLIIRGQGWRNRAILYGSTIILLLAALTRWHGIKTDELAKKKGRDEGWRAVVSGDLQDPALGFLFPDPAFIRAVYPFLVSHHFAGVAVPQKVAAIPLPRCDGWVDQITPAAGGAIYLKGWAYDYTLKSPARQVDLVSANGRILKSTGTGLPRPDVPKSIPTVQSDRTGWQATWSTPPSGTYKMYVVINGQPDCALNGTVLVH